MTADDNHYPGPDVGTAVAGIVTAALALLAVWGLIYLVVIIR